MEKQVITAMYGDNQQSSEVEWISPADLGAQRGSEHPSAGQTVMVVVVESAE